jgi:transposase
MASLPADTACSFHPRQRSIFLRQQRQILSPLKTSGNSLPLKQLAWLMTKQPDKLVEYEQILLTHLQSDPDIAVIYPLSQQFGSMVRDRQDDNLDAWLQACLNTSIIPLCNFAIGLQQEYASIRAAFELPWSNGQTEGHVNRLKFIKRQMYGRAHFDLLRLRVLHYAGST